MLVWPISPRVNSPKNDGAGILEPIAVEGEDLFDCGGKIIKFGEPAKRASAPQLPLGTADGDYR